MRQVIPTDADQNGATVTTRAESIDRITRERLVCPQDLGPLLDAGDDLYNPRLRVAYRIDADGIPVLLADEARPVNDAEHHKITES